MNGLEDKEPHMIISTDTAKFFVKSIHTFMIKVLENVGLEGIYFNIIKAI